MCEVVQPAPPLTEIPPWTAEIRRYGRRYVIEFRSGIMHAMRTARTRRGAEKLARRGLAELDPDNLQADETWTVVGK